MIVIKLLGGLGNQLFQRAYGLALEARGYQVGFDKSALIEGTHREYSLDKLNTNVRFLEPKHPYINEQSLAYDVSLTSPRDPSTIIGYFQSEKYFSHIAAGVREHFSFIGRVSEHALGLYDEISNSNSVAVHVRRGDYINLQSFHGLLPKDYYEVGLDKIQQAAGKLNIFVFSDDPEWCNANFEYGVVEHTTKYEDLFLISHCQHAVIANSSFSWWGAWLGDTKPGRIVVAPKQWFTGLSPEEYRDIVPERWIKI